MGVNEVDRERRTPLIIAAINGNHEIVRALCGHKAIALDYRDRDGYSAALHAAANGHIQVIRELHAFRADLECTLPNGITPLMLATMEGHQDIVKELIQAKVNIDQRTKVSIIKSSLYLN